MFTHPPISICSDFITLTVVQEFCITLCSLLKHDKNFNFIRWSKSTTSSQTQSSNEFKNPERFKCSTLSAIDSDSSLVLFHDSGRETKHGHMYSLF